MKKAEQEKHMAAIRQYIASNNFDQAWQLINRHQSDLPYGAQHERAQCYFGQGEYQKALIEYNLLSKNMTGRAYSSDNKFWGRERANCLLLLKQFEAIVQLVKDDIKKNIDDRTYPPPPYLWHILYEVDARLAIGTASKAGYDENINDCLDKLNKALTMASHSADMKWIMDMMTIAKHQKELERAVEASKSDDSSLKRKHNMVDGRIDVIEIDKDDEKPLKRQKVDEPRVDTPAEINQLKESVQELKKAIHGLKPQCVVCMDKTRDALLDPCKHLVMCHGCATQLKNADGGASGACPICRVNITSVTRVFL